MRVHIRERPRTYRSGRRVCVTLLAVFVFVGVCGCDRNGSNEPVSEHIGVTSTGAQGSQYEIAGSLIKRYVEQADGRHVAVEIDTDSLEELLARQGSDEDLPAFRDPLLAAKLFGPHIGVPAGAEYATLERSHHPEEGSGLFIALVQVTGGDHPVTMRMTSEPDSHDQPTLWVLNDYQQ